MQIPPSNLRVGDRVRVRGQRWRIRGIRDYDTCRLLTLVGTGPDNGSAESNVLTPFDAVRPLRERRRIHVRGPRAWQPVVRALVVEDAPADALRTAARADIDLLPHQLEPALALLRGLGTRVLLADEVGLGKTVQAALAIAELKARGLADRLLVLTPPGLRDQWRAELARRFSIEAVLVDARTLRRLAAAAPVGVNPWATLSAAVASTDFIKRAEVLPFVTDAPWDVVVLDEAHNASLRSDRYAGAAALCRRAPYVLLLSATPHNGDRAAFESLCRLGAAGGDPLLIFRRSRRDVALGVRRRVHRLRVAPTAAERLMFLRLAMFCRAVRSEHSDAGGALALSLGVLHKRAYSSPWSLTRSVERRLESLTPSAAPEAQIELPLASFGDEQDPEDEPPAWPVPPMSDPERERRLLEGVVDAAREAVGMSSKVRVLRRLLRRLRQRGEPAIVYTEYRDTLVHLRRELRIAAAVLHGGLTSDERRAALAEFASGSAAVLLATDAAGEGLNLQEACRVVVNLELPWNPNRLEQRAGRVDRIGQRRIVHAFHLIAERAGERRIMERLRERTDRARLDIDAADPLGLFENDAPRNAAADGALPRCSVDASAEHARLLLSRRLLASGRMAGNDSAETVVVRARRKARRASESGALALTRSVLEDAGGCPIATRVRPVLLTLRDGVATGLDAAQIEVLLAELVARVSAVDAAELAEWARSNRATFERLIHCRLARERAVSAGLANRIEHVQLGLFDKRAERAAQTRSSRDAARAAALVDRVNQLTRALGPGDLVTEVPLVLLPRTC